MAHKLIALFVRHGSTELNDAGKFRGPLDPSLDENGKEQAKQVKDQLAGYKSGQTFTSDKKRSKQTAKIAMPDAEPKEVKDLAPLNVGEFAGQPKNDENMKQIEHYQNNPDEQIPGGESINEFRNRVNPKLKMIIKRGMESRSPSVAFVHSSTIHQLGHLLHDDHNHVKVKPGGIAGVFKGPYGVYAKALTKQSTDKKDQHMVS
jgi:broad specificity phosphatase PhoE